MCLGKLQTSRAHQSGHLPMLQVNGTITPVPSLTINSLALSVAPGVLNASTNGTIHGSPVAVELSSIAQAGEGSRRMGSIRVTSSGGATLDSLLSSQTNLVKADMGFNVPRTPVAGYGTNPSPSFGEVVFDSIHGLRMVNVTMAASSQLGLADLARRLGFVWQGTQDGTDVVSFMGPRVYYVPRRRDAPALFWRGKELAAPELGVAATLNVPPLGIENVRGTLLVQNGSRLTIEVGCMHLAPEWLHPGNMIHMQSSNVYYILSGIQYASVTMCYYASVTMVWVHARSTL
jgi:hypothetical protein